MPVWAATASAWRAWAPCRSLCESRISSPVDTTVASTWSPIATRSLPSSSASSERSIHASPLPPTSTNTLSAEIWMTRPFTTWPTSSTGLAASRANMVAKSSGSFMLPTLGGRPQQVKTDHIRVYVSLRLPHSHPPPESPELLTQELEGVRRGPVEDHAGRERIEKQEEHGSRGHQVSPLAPDQRRGEHRGAKAQQRRQRHAAHQERQHVQLAAEERHARGQCRQRVRLRQVADPEKRHALQIEILREHVEDTDEHRQLDQEAREALQGVERVHTVLAVERDRPARTLLAAVCRLDRVDP